MKKAVYNLFVSLHYGMKEILMHIKSLSFSAVLLCSDSREQCNLICFAYEIYPKIYEFY